MLHWYNLLGCWILTFLLVAAKVVYTVDVSWLWCVSPVLLINGWFVIASIYRRISLAVSR